MRKLTYLCAAVFAATLLLAAAPAPSVQSAETIVTSTENEGPGTLREAVLSVAPGDTITFDTDIFAPDDPATIHLNGPITLGQGGLTVDGSNAGVILDGMDGPESGFIIESSDNIVYGIKFINFSFSGIAIIGGNTPGKGENNQIGGDREKGDSPYGQGNCFGLSTTGVVIERGAANNTVSGNLVGIDTDGSDLGNTDGGILVRAGSNGNTIGPNNIIANNNAYGIQAEGSDPITITKNAIFNQEIPVELVNGSNSEMRAGVEINTLVAANGQVGGDYMPNPITTLEVFSGDATGPRFFEGSLVLNPDDIPEGSDRSAFFMDKGSPFKGSYLYFAGTSDDGRTTAFSEGISLEAGLDEMLGFLPNPRRVWLDTFEDDSRKDMWMSNGLHQIMDGMLVFDNPNPDDWQMLAFGGTAAGFVQDAGDSGSQAVYFTFHYDGSKDFRFQMGNDATAVGLMFQEGGYTCFSETPDYVPQQTGQITIQPGQEYRVLLAIDDISGEQHSAIWPADHPENALTCGGQVNPDLVETHWGFGVGASNATRIELDNFQFLAFGY